MDEILKAVPSFFRDYAGFIVVMSLICFGNYVLAPFYKCRYKKKPVIVVNNIDKISDKLVVNKDGNFYTGKEHEKRKRKLCNLDLDFPD